jgi:hypothetical protein
MVCRPLTSVARSMRAPAAAVRERVANERPVTLSLAYRLGPGANAASCPDRAVQPTGCSQRAYLAGHPGCWTA